MSEGFCEFSIDAEYDGDEASFMDSREVCARKPHKCCECGEVIPAGVRYRRVSGKWDGRVDTSHFCLPCEEAAGEFFSGSRTFGIFWSEMQGNWDEGANLQACLNRLTSVAAKEHMRRQWLKWKGLGDNEQPREQV